MAELLNKLDATPVGATPGGTPTGQRSATRPRECARPLCECGSVGSRRVGRGVASGDRVVAVATRTVTEQRSPKAADETGLDLVGLLVFLDPPKPDAAKALQRLAGLGISVKVVTGDNAAVAVKVCQELGLDDDGGAITGSRLADLDDDALAALIATTTVVARMKPVDKARIVWVQRRSGGGSRSSVMASMTPWPCTPQTSASLSTRPPASPT